MIGVQHPPTTQIHGRPPLGPSLNSSAASSSTSERPKFSTYCRPASRFSIDPVQEKRFEEWKKRNTERIRKKIQQNSVHGGLRLYEYSVKPTILKSGQNSTGGTDSDRTTNGGVGNNNGDGSSSIVTRKHTAIKLAPISPSRSATNLSASATTADLAPNSGRRKRMTKTRPRARSTTISKMNHLDTSSEDGDAVGGHHGIHRSRSMTIKASRNGNGQSNNNSAFEETLNLEKIEKEKTQRSFAKQAKSIKAGLTVGGGSNNKVKKAKSVKKIDKKDAKANARLDKRVKSLVREVVRQSISEVMSEERHILHLRGV